MTEELKKALADLSRRSDYGCVTMMDSLLFYARSGWRYEYPVNAIGRQKLELELRMSLARHG